jgi:hypothetical protein
MEEKKKNELKNGLPDWINEVKKEINEEKRKKASD